MTGTQLSVEWALWGKEAQSRDYRLLECSDGGIGAGAFTEAITRYSPGNLERLPQVTVSWLRPQDGERYLAMAIHDEGPGLHDPGGRKIVFTRYFCAPYDQIAAQTGSYQSMHAAFDPVRLEAWPARCRSRPAAGTCTGRPRQPAFPAGRWPAPDLPPGMHPACGSGEPGPAAPVP